MAVADSPSKLVPSNSSETLATFAAGTAACAFGALAVRPLAVGPWLAVPRAALLVVRWALVAFTA